MKLKLAIVLCKVLRFVGGLIGKGSTLPGQFALKVCPDVLGRVKLPERIIAVTGSNGKTSTVEMIAAILKADGKQVDMPIVQQIKGSVSNYSLHRLYPFTLSRIHRAQRSDACPSSQNSFSAANSFQRLRWCSSSNPASSSTSSPLVRARGKGS